MADRKARMSLLSRYSTLHFEKYGTRPTHNINAEQWAADNLIESYTLPMCYDLLQYYFDNARTPTWKYFANFAEKILESRNRQEEDFRERIERRKMAKEWLND
jgi:hypothetical protein